MNRPTPIRPTPVYRRALEGRVHVFDATPVPWHDTSNPGLKLKLIRDDDAQGEFLGLVRFEPFTRSGLHQHRGVATSFVLVGGLTDHHGSVRLHEVGINVFGSTHDAMAYEPVVLVSRLEGPVLYPPSDGISGVHAGSRYGEFRNPDPDVPPEINVATDAVTGFATGAPGVMRQTLFDYAGTGSAHRMVQLTLRAETALPAFEASHWTEFWVRGGEVWVNGQRAWANCFVIAEPGARVELSSPFGALLLGWAEGRERWRGGEAIDLFGF